MEPATHLAPFVELLAEEGFRPRVEGEGDEAFISFKWEGVSFLMVPDPAESRFFHLVARYELPRPLDYDLLLAANELNAAWKVVKAVVVAAEGAIDFHFEAHLGEQGSMAPLLARALPALRSGAAHFFKEVSCDAANSDDLPKFAN